MSKTVYEEWIKAKEIELREMWESMGIVEKFEEGPSFEDFCKSQYEQDEYVCKDCGSISGACFYCKP